MDTGYYMNGRFLLNLYGNLMYTLILHAFSLCSLCPFALLDFMKVIEQVFEYEPGFRQPASNPDIPSRIYRDHFQMSKKKHSEVLTSLASSLTPKYPCFEISQH